MEIYSKAKKWNSNRNKAGFFWLIFGCILGILFCTPFLILGEQSVITYHDQLDGEIITYLLNAKHLFEGLDRYTEVMNGIPVQGMISPAPLFVPLYRFFSPFVAFLITQILIVVLGYVGMFLLAGEVTSKKWVAFFAGIGFMMLPFYPVYGFCIVGQPLLWFAVWKLCSDWKRNLWAYAVIILYAAGSSAVLVGFACCLALLLVTVFAFASKKKSRVSLLIGTALLAGTYLLFNLRLLQQFVQPSMGYISHKSELVLSPSPFWSSFWSCFSQGVDYAKSDQLFILIPVALAVILISWRLSLAKCSKRVKEEQKEGFFKEYKLTMKEQSIWRTMLILLGVQVLISLLYAFYHCEWITAWRNEVGGLIKEFNADRIAWLMPVVWYVILACALALLAESAIQCPKWVRMSVTLTTAALLLGVVCFHSSIKPNVMKLLKGGDYYALTWEQFYAQDIFAQIDAEIGRPKEDYRVASYGIYPAAASYNGFYSLDGYSNNYELSYKHEFRKVMAAELDKSDYLANWFDDWGNRCYITTAEMNNYYTFEKKWGTVIYEFDIDTKQLRDMGCEYLFSAAYIMDAENKGMYLLREEPFETDESWYRIYVYVLGEQKEGANGNEQL